MGPRRGPPARSRGSGLHVRPHPVRPQRPARQGRALDGPRDRVSRQPAPLRGGGALRRRHSRARDAAHAPPVRRQRNAQDRPGSVGRDHAQGRLGALRAPAGPLRRQRRRRVADGAGARGRAGDGAATESFVRPHASRASRCRAVREPCGAGDRAGGARAGRTARRGGRGAGRAHCPAPVERRPGQGLFVSRSARWLGSAVGTARQGCAAQGGLHRRPRPARRTADLRHGAGRGQRGSAQREGGRSGAGLHSRAPRHPRGARLHSRFAGGRHALRRGERPVRRADSREARRDRHG